MEAVGNGEKENREERDRGQSMSETAPVRVGGE